MAARVTKLFLQPSHREPAGPSAAVQAATGASGKAKAAKLVALGKKPVAAAAPANKKTLKRSKKPTAGKKPREHFLVAARRELAKADRTRENVRKLRVKTPPKTQKLMAKALAQRQALLR